MASSTEKIHLVSDKTSTTSRSTSFCTDTHTPMPKKCIHVYCELGGGEGGKGGGGGGGGGKEGRGGEGGGRREGGGGGGKEGRGGRGRGGGGGGVSAMYVLRLNLYLYSVLCLIFLTVYYQK